MTKRKKRYRWLLTLLSVLLFLLAACSGTSGGGEKTDAGTDAPKPRLILIRGGSSDYRIVVPQSEDAMFDVGYALAAKLRTLTGVNLQVVPDRYEPAAHEILLGRTNRSDGTDESLLSGARDYIIRQKDGRLFLWGLSTQSVSAAVETLAGLFLVEGDTLTVPAVLDQVYPGGVSFASLREGGYVIVAGDGSAASAATLQAAIEQKTGYRPAVVGTSAAPVPNEILIGRTGRAESRQVQETLDADKTHIRMKKQRKKLVIFEMKIAGGLAAAMLMLFLLPIAAQGEQAGDNSVKEPTAIEVKIQEFFHTCRQISDRMVEGITEASDRMLNPWLDKSAESTEETEPVKEPGQIE